MFDFGSKKITLNIPFQATSGKKLGGELGPWMFPPVSKILATRLGEVLFWSHSLLVCKQIYRVDR